MVLQASGPISLSEINAEYALGTDLNSYRGTQYYTPTAGPFTFSAGALGMNAFYNTQKLPALTQADLAAHAHTYRASLCRWCLGDGYYADHYYQRNSSPWPYTYTGTYANTGLPYMGNWTTIVVSLSGSRPYLNSLLVNGTNYFSSAVHTVHTVHPNWTTAGICQFLLRVNIDHRNITSIQPSWYAESGGNTGNWCHIGMTPGWWNYSVASRTTAGNLVSSIYGSSMAFHVGSGWQLGNSRGSVVATGMTAVIHHNAWYNQCFTFPVYNYTGGIKSATVTPSMTLDKDQQPNNWEIHGYTNLTDCPTIF